VDVGRIEGLDMTREAGKLEDYDVPPVREGQCQRCGACCVNVGRPLFEPEEVSDLPPDIRHIVEWFEHRDPNRDEYVTPCYFFNMVTRKCLIYEHRPYVCREFKPGRQVCKELRRAFAPCLSRFNEDMQTRH
jgi:Fe-S-cluster containining protein